MPARGESIEEQKLTGISETTKSDGKDLNFSDVNNGGNGEVRLAAAAVPSTMVDNFSLNQVRPVDETTMRASGGAKGGHGASFRGTKQHKRVPWRVQVVRTMDHWALQVFLFACLFVALFTVDVVALTSGPDAVDDPVNGLLVGVLIVFALEIFFNTLCRDKYIWSFFFWMDIVGTLSILTDVSWLAAGWLETDSTDAKAGRLKNASKIARLVRLVRVVRVVKLLTYMEKLNQRRQGQVDDVKGAPTSLGKNLSESVSRQVAALVLLTVLVAPLLIYDETDQSVTAYLNVFELNVGKSMAELQPLVDDYFGFINADVKAVVLMVGEHTWDLRLTDERSDFTKRSSDKVEVNGNGVYMANDQRSKNHQEAMLNIILVCVVIVELVFFTAVLNTITGKLVIRPMERIFHVLQDSAAQIMSSLGMKAEDLEELDDDEEDNEEEMMNAMEETIAKMGKLVKHFKKKGSAVDDLVGNEDIDESTLAYLKQAAGEGASAKKERPRQSMEQNRRAGSPGPVAPVGMVVPRNGHQGGANGLNVPGMVGSNLEVVEGVSIDKLNSWEFSVFELSKQDLVLCVCRMFHEMGFVQSGLVNPRTLFNFVTEVEKGMRDNPYHNWRHVCDVTHTLYRYISLIQDRADLSENEKFAMMVAAISHDLGHVGVNNAFLVRKRDELALTYNDQSVLENYHAAQLYRTIEGKPECDIFAQLEDEDAYREVRKQVIDMILHTDMVHHFPMTSQVEVFCDVNSDNLQGDGCPFESKEDRKLMFNMLLHAADISNPVKPFPIYKKWADVVLAEFFSQGDMEKDEGVPVSPMMDRDTTSRPGSQIGFIEFLVGPLYGHMLKIFPELGENAAYLIENRQLFGEDSIKEFEANPDKTSKEKEEERKKLEGRFKGFVGKFPKAVQEKAKALSAKPRPKTT